MPFRSSQSAKIINFNIKNFGITDIEFNKLPFGRQIEYFRKLEEFKSSPETKKTWVSQKRKTTSKAIKEFKQLYQPKEFYLVVNNSENYRDDSFEIFYRD